MRDDGVIEVLVETGGAWYELRELDGHTAAELSDHARSAYGNRWLKRLGEDLDCVYEFMGVEMGPTVHAVLVDAAGRQLRRDIECTIAKRRSARRVNAG